MENEQVYTYTLKVTPDNGAGTHYIVVTSTARDLEARFQQKLANFRFLLRGSKTVEVEVYGQTFLTPAYRDGQHFAVHMGIGRDGSFRPGQTACGPFDSEQEAEVWIARQDAAAIAF